MSMFPRTPVASLVCPSAPFLAPRLLRASVPRTALSAPCSTPQRPTYATEARGKDKGRALQETYRGKARGESKRGPLARGIDSKPTEADKSRRISHGRAVVRTYVGQERRKLSQPEDEGARLLEQFRAACDARNIRPLMDLYPSFVATNLLSPNDTRRVAQALHAFVRGHGRRTDPQAPVVLPFLRKMIEDIRAGVLPPHPYAHVHLLSIFKEVQKYHEGYAFWQWLVEQDENHVSQAVYGAAIELMAYGGISTLPELESLYMDGLKRFPGTFAEYHFSPDAVVPDRSHPVFIAGLPVLLLQGILTARILCRDWKNAYMALDTALRLYPVSLPPRLFELFMTERPLPEAYTVYLVACRAGVVFKPSHLTALIKQMRAAMTSSSFLQDRMVILRAIANAVYAYLEAGGSLEGEHVGAFLSAFNLLFPDKPAGFNYKGEEAELRNISVTTAHEIMSNLVQAGMPPQSHQFNALIHLAGKLRVPDLLRVSLQDVKTAQIEIGDIGYRTVLTSAGLLGNQQILEEFWSRIARKAETEGRQIAYQDWITLAKACRRAAHVDYCTEQLSKFQHAILSSHQERVVSELARQDTPPTNDAFVPMGLKDFSSEIEGLKTQIKNIAAVVMSGQPLNLSTTPFYMFLDPARPALGSLENLRTVYDELTVDPHQPPAPPTEGSTVSAPLSPTGIPLDELRFQNWMSIMELMDETSYFEDKRKRDIAERVRKGLPLDPTSKEQVHLTRRKGAPVRPIIQLQQLRERITNLRSGGPNTFRRLGSFAFPRVAKTDVAEKSNDKPTEESRTTATSASEIDVQVQPNEPWTSPDVLRRRPALRLYVSLESDHEAPAPPALSRRPLGKPKSPKHHALRLQPTPPSPEESNTQESSTEESAGQDTPSSETPTISDTNTS